MDAIVPVQGKMCLHPNYCYLVDIKIDVSSLFSISAVDSTSLFLCGFLPVIVFYVIGLKFGTILKMFRML